ncbi:MAG: alpha-E domain-containing protein [Gammaproteobacteria bacterium]
MLSRVAERVYWLGRYIERAENTARLVNVHTHLLLDLPRTTQVAWRALIEIIGMVETFNERFQHGDERNVVKFLLADQANPFSVLSSLAMARENARTAREILPSEVWEAVNDLYLYAKDNAASGIMRSGRHPFLNQTVAFCQQLAGSLAGGMSHDSAYDFIQLGRNLERADMTSRIVDVGASNVLPKLAHTLTDENILWMSVLYSLGAYHMYRRQIEVRVINAAEVTKFLLQNEQLPRAVLHCLLAVDACIKRLPRNETALRRLTRIMRRVNEAPVDGLAKEGLHEFIDRLQVDLSELHKAITETWFLPAEETEGDTPDA